MTHLDAFAGVMRTFDTLATGADAATAGHPRTAFVATFDLSTNDGVGIRLHLTSDGGSAASQRETFEARAAQDPGRAPASLGSAEVVLYHERRQVLEVSVDPSRIDVTTDPREAPVATFLRAIVGREGTGHTTAFSVALERAGRDPWIAHRAPHVPSRFAVIETLATDGDVKKRFLRPTEPEKRYEARRDRRVAAASDLSRRSAVFLGSVEVLYPGEAPVVGRADVEIEGVLLDVREGLSRDRVRRDVMYVQVDGRPPLSWNLREPGAVDA